MTPCRGTGGSTTSSKLSWNNCQTMLYRKPEYTVWVKVSLFVTWRHSDVALKVFSYYCCLCIPRTLRFYHHRYDRTEYCVGANQNCQPFILIHEIDYTLQTTMITFCSIFNLELRMQGKETAYKTGLYFFQISVINIPEDQRNLYLCLKWTNIIPSGQIMSQAKATVVIWIA
jgi:hypothetical protein